MKVGVSTVLREKNPHKLAALAVALCGLSPFLLWPRHRTKPIIWNTPQPTSQSTPMVGVTTTTKNPLQIAILHWYDANRSAHFTVGSEPVGVASDGANMWVANLNSGTATKLRASDGANLGAFASETFPISWPLMGPTSG